MKKLTLLVLGFSLSASLYAFPCHFTVVKDSCWTDYDVTVDVLETEKDTKITDVLVPKGQSWQRTQFECSPKQVLLFRAKFSPAFWKTDEDKVYNAKRYWSLPETIVTNAKGWDIKVCYPKDFAAVPLPPAANNKCACNMDEVPEVPR